MTERKAIHGYKVKTEVEFYLGESTFKMPVEFVLRDFDGIYPLQKLIEMEFKHHNLEFNKKKRHFFITQLW